MKNINSKIRISAVHSADGERQETDTETDCAAFFKDGKLIAFYEEDALENTDTVLLYENGKLTIRRRGAYASEMVFCKGIKTDFAYAMPYGSVEMSLRTKDIQYTKMENSVGIKAEYELINGSFLQNNSININIIFI